MRRKILSLFLAIVLVLGTMTNIVFATDTQVHTAQFFNSATDESVDDLNDASSVYADLNFTAPITGEASVIAALYDVNEYFKEAVILGTINMMQGEVAQYHTPDITIGDAQMLKIFVWDGLTSMEPMTDASVISRKIESGGSGSDVEIETGVTTENISLSTQNASAEIPMGVAVSGDTDVLTLSMEVMSTSQSGVEAGEDEELSSVDVHIEGISKDNTVPIIVTLQNVVEGGFNEGNINLYHVEEDKTKKMTRVNSEAELDAHNEYLYNPVDGTLKLALASFSEIAILSDTNNAWEGKIVTDLSGTGTKEDPYIIANADELAGMSKLVSTDNATYGEAFYKLNADVNFGNSSEKNKIFYPIGWWKPGEGENAAGETEWYTYGGSFRGTFDGAGHTVSGIFQNTWIMDGDYDNGYYNDAMGLFGYVVDGTVKNLIIDNFVSEGEYAPTGCVTAYAMGECTFENISLTNCHPQTYNTGVAGIIGWDDGGDDETEAEKTHYTFNNITIDNSNIISALWGSWDVAAGGLMGYLGKHSKVDMTNCHVAAQIDVYNDVCGNYQYYWYRYSGMMIGTIDHHITDENGYVTPYTGNITANNCTVHFGEWNDYYYCELVDNSLASYTHDHQFSRLVNVDSVDTENKTVTIAGEIIDVPKSGRANYVVVDGEASTENATCYHFKDGEVWNHVQGGYETTDVDGDGVVDTNLLKEDRQHYYLPFNQLFTGYGWGVKNIPVYNGDDYAFDGITILGSREEANSVTKFESTASDIYVTGEAVTIGELFKDIAPPDAPIKAENVQVSVSPVDDKSTAGGVYTADTTNWTNGTLKFSGKGEANITITDYYFCTPTTITVTVSGEKFDSKFNEDFLYRVGNKNTVSLGSLFKEKKADCVRDEMVTVTVTNVAGEVTYTYTANTTDWTQGKIQFANTGVVTVTIQDGDSDPLSLTLEVVNAKNITGATGSIDGTDVVLLNDVTISADGTAHYTNCTVYGNGFTYDVRGGMNMYNSKQGHGIIITSGATLDNLVIIGDVYDTYGAYSIQEDYTSAIDATNTIIRNCHISNCSTPIRANGVTVKDTTLYGGTVANMIISGGTNTLDGVTTVNYNDKDRSVLGFGIVISDGASDSTKLILNGDLKQHNFVCSEDATDVPDTNAQKLFGAMFDDAYSNYHIAHTDGKEYVNTGILSMVSTFDKSDITDNTENGYTGTTVSFATATGYLYSLPAAGNSIDNGYNPEADNHKATVQGDYLPTFDFDLGEQEVSYEGADDTRYLTGDKDGVEALYMSNESPITLDLTKLATVYKYDGTSYTVTASYKDSDGNVLGTDTTVTLTKSGSLAFTVTDNIFYDENGAVLNKSVQRTYEVPVTVIAKSPAIKNAVIKVNKTDLTGTYAAKSLIDNSQYLSFNPLDAITVTDYDASGTGAVVDLTANISTTEVTYVNTTSGAWGGATITMTYTDGRVLTIVLGAASGLNSPGASSGGKTITVTNGAVKSDGTVAKKSATGGTWPITSYSFKGNSGSTVTNNTVVTVTFTDVNSGSSGCFAEGTMITLADGTQKPIEQITHSDELLAWDFNTGKYVTTVPSLIESHEANEYRVISLEFDDGTMQRVIVDHGFFDVEDNKFVYIDEENVASYVGHQFVKVGENETYESVELIGYEITVENVSYHTIQTAIYNNCIAEDMFTLTSPPEMLDNDEWFDYFEIGDNMKYDEEKMQADIEKYGLYTYEDFAEYVTYEQFIAFNGPYLKVLVGRGVVTYEQILNLISTYVTSAK